MPEHMDAALMAVSSSIKLPKPIKSLDEILMASSLDSISATFPDISVYCVFAW
jgi:hypothetical protein